MSSRCPSAEIAALQRKLERYTRRAGDAELVSAGIPALDRLLPGGGLRPGSLVEYLAADRGQGAGSLALAAARVVCQEGRPLVVLDRLRNFYPVACSTGGIPLSQILLLRPASEAEERWALDQVLRCPGVGAVWGMCGVIGPHDFRRLQLAAESGGALGLLVRSARQRGQPTWADVQWLVEPEPSNDGRRVRVELVRCRGGISGRSVRLELNEETGAWREMSDSHAKHPLPIPASLADSAPARRAADA
jgi:protein ImuA